MTAIKICGLRSVNDARHCVSAGVDAVGINFHPQSKRFCEEAAARRIVEAVGADVLTVGVFVDATFEEIEATRERVGFRCVQLHGEEPPELLERLLPHAYKALKVRGPETLAEAERFGGEHLLLDAFVPGEPGGTGQRFDWSLAVSLAGRRNVTLAGGLTPDNVGLAIATVAPFCVDVAGGVEAAAGVKDPARVDAFVDAVRRADAA